MRLGIVLDLASTAVQRVPECASVVDLAGLDLLWLRAARERPHDAVPAAASCVTAAANLHLGAHIPVGNAHPLYLAEERNVVDQLLGGRFVLALEGADVAELDEWTALLLKAGAPLPFDHTGPRFHVPAALPENTVNTEERVRVTPSPGSLEPALWLTGPAGTEVAADYGLSLLAGEDTTGAEAWGPLRARLGRAALRLRRPALRSWDPAAEDAAMLAHRLAAERDTAGLDTALIRPVMRPGGDDWHHAVAELAHVVRPRVQTHRSPPGLEDFWDRQRRTDREAMT